MRYWRTQWSIYITKVLLNNWCACSILRVVQVLQIFPFSPPLEFHERTSSLMWLREHGEKSEFSEKLGDLRKKVLSWMLVVEWAEGKEARIPKPDDLEENMWLGMKQFRGIKQIITIINWNGNLDPVKRKAIRATLGQKRWWERIAVGMCEPWNWYKVIPSGKGRPSSTLYVLEVQFC